MSRLLTTPKSVHSTRKRARVDSPAKSAATALTPTPKPTKKYAPIKRDEEFWLEDGTLFVVAGGVDFRVYQGLLVDRSPTFRGMLSMTPPLPHQLRPTTLRSQPPCLAIELQERPEDVRALLRALMPSAQPKPFPKARIVPFESVLACILTAHKYEVQHVVEEGLDYLRRFYPCDLATYDSTRHTYPAECAIGVVHVARLTGAHDLLPTAVLACAELDAHALVAGYLRTDGTRVVLSTRDLALCMDARTALVRECVRRLFLLWLWPGRCAPVCTSGCVCDRRGDDGRCWSELCAVHAFECICGGGKVVLASATRDLDAYASPGMVLGLGMAEMGGDMVCEECRVDVWTREQSLRREAWNLLPDMVGVDVPERWRLELI